MRRKWIGLLFSLIIAITTSVTPAAALTWSIHVHRLTDYAFFDAFPSVTQFENGTMMTVWSAEAPDNLSLFYSLSHDFGSTWPYQSNLTEAYASGDDSSPSVVQLNNGTIFVAWSSNRPPPPPPPEPDFTITASPQYFTIPQDFSKNSTITITSLNDFSEPVNLRAIGLPLSVTATFDPTDVTPPPNGIATSIMNISVGATAIPGSYAFSVLGRSEKLTHSVLIYLDVIPAATGAQTAHLSQFYTEVEAVQDSEIYYKVSHNYTASWSGDIQLTDDEVEDVDPSVFQAANGTIYVFWSSNRYGNYDVFYKMSSDFGSSWSDTIQVTHDASDDKGPSVMQAFNGSIWLTWCSNRYGNYEIMYKTCTGSEWFPEMRLTDSTSSDTSPSILQTLDDKIWIFWASDPLTPTGNTDIYYKNSNDNGDTWSSQSIQFTTDTAQDTWPCATQTSDTKVWVVWTSNRGAQPDGNWDIYYRTSLAGDINEDGVIDDTDLVRVSEAFGYHSWELGYDANVDMNKDGLVDLRDLVIVALHYGDT